MANKKSPLAITGIVLTGILLITLASFFIPTGDGINKDYFSLHSRWQMTNSGKFTEFFYSSDGNNFIYVAEDKNTFSQLYLYNTLKNNLTLLTTGDYHHNSPVITNDNKALYYRKYNASECSINHLDLYTREISFVYACKKGIKDFNLDISPDNNHLIISEQFINQTHGAVIFDLTHLDVTQEIVFEEDISNQLSVAVFSPSGNQIAFIVSNPLSNKNGILMYHLIKKQWTQLNLNDLVPSLLTWGNNDSELYFSSNQKANQGIWFTNTVEFSNKRISSSPLLDMQYDRKNNRLIIARKNKGNSFGEVFLTNDVLIESWDSLK